MKTVSKLMIGLALVALLVLPAMATRPTYTCGPHDMGTCPAGQACTVTGQDCGWGDWSNGKCPGGHDTQTCDQDWFFMGWYHRHWTCEDNYACVATTMTISGYKYVDTDQSGTVSEGDAPLAGVDIYLYCSGHAPTSGNHAVTNENGFYTFTVPITGCGGDHYEIVEAVPEGYIAVNPTGTPYAGYCLMGVTSNTQRNFLNTPEVPECNNCIAFRASIPASDDPTPYNVGYAPVEVEFWANDCDTVTPLPEGITTLWDFGDGTTSTEAEMDSYGQLRIKHIYAAPGIYDVTLTATFPDGCPTTTTETKGEYLQVFARGVEVRSSMTPYTEAACQELINAQYPMDGINPADLPLLDLRNTYVSAAFKYASQFDCAAIAYYTRGEPSYDKDCTSADWWGRTQEEVHSYGGMPILTAPNPAQAICFLAVKNSPTENSLPVEITITDSHNTVGDVIVSSDPVIKECYQLPEDFNECRLRNAYDPFQAWQNPVEQETPEEES